MATLLVLGCNKSDTNPQYTIFNDNNGTKSPRLKETSTEYFDNEGPQKSIVLYTYSDDNLLILKEETQTYINQHNRIHTDQYKHNKDKQISTIDSSQSGASFTKFSMKIIYGELIHASTNLAAIIKKESSYLCCGNLESREFEYEYFLNSEGKADKLKIETVMIANSFTDPYSSINVYSYLYDDKGNIIEERENDKKIHYQYNEKNNIIKKTTDDGQTIFYEYTSSGKISTIIDVKHRSYADTISHHKTVYLYTNQGLTDKIKTYFYEHSSTQASNDSNYTLQSIKKYEYEDKKHYRQSAFYLAPIGDVEANYFFRSIYF